LLNLNRMVCGWNILVKLNKIFNFLHKNDLLNTYNMSLEFDVLDLIEIDDCADKRPADTHPVEVTQPSTKDGYEHGAQQTIKHTGVTTWYQSTCPLLVAVHDGAAMDCSDD